MKNERRIKVDFPDVDITSIELPKQYLAAGRAVVEHGEVSSVEDFVRNLREYNDLQYRLMEKTESLCDSMENMVDNDFVVVNDLAKMFDDIDRITERMDNMIYFVPRDDVLDVLERYLSIHQRLFNKPVFYVQNGFDAIKQYDL